MTTYTRCGDNGMTSTAAGARVSKSDQQIAISGLFDQAIAQLGSARVSLERELRTGFHYQQEKAERRATMLESLASSLMGWQNRLFTAACCAFAPDATRAPLCADDIILLETVIDRMEARIEPTHAFVLPGGNESSARLEEARCAIRNLERELCAIDGVNPLACSYINRLSDALYVGARYALAADEISEHTWTQECAPWQELIATLKEYERPVVAYSGGVDSTLVAYAARKARGEHARVVFIDTMLISNEERANAAAVAEELGLDYEVLTLDITSIGEVAHNREERCYFCKRALFERLQQEVPDGTLLDGTNAEDVHDDRPGLKALTECKVASPLAQLGIGKLGVRTLAASLGFPNATRPSGPCLATRVAFDHPLSEELLERIEEAESRLHNLGYPIVRVRTADGFSCSIEVAPAEVRRATSEEEALKMELEDLFYPCSVDPLGYRGSLA